MKKILIVEDDKVVALINKRMVEKIGHRAYCCVSTGKEAIQTTKKTNPDVILMDIQLEGKMNGIEAMKEIRKFSTTPVIFISGNISNETHEAIQKTGNATFLAKPVEIMQLQEALGKLVCSGV